MIKFSERPGTGTLLAKQEAMREANERCARIILQRPDLFSGLQVEWAKLVVAKAQASGLAWK